MASNQKNLKYFVRVDASGRKIQGSGVLRLKKPVNGKWVEDYPTFICCGPTTSTSTSTTSTTSTTTTSPSDIRLKMNIITTGNRIGQFAEYKWDWNSTAISLGLGHYRQSGVIAQELIEAGSDAVFMGEDGFYRVDYSKVV